MKAILYGQFCFFLAIIKQDIMAKFCAGGQDESMVGGFWFRVFPCLSLDSLLFILTIHFVCDLRKVLGSLSLHCDIVQFSYLEN